MNATTTNDEGVTACDGHPSNPTNNELAIVAGDPARCETIAREINELHRLAIKHAGQAIDHAQRAGKLLLEVKARLQHGEFLPWMQANVEVTPRQAQRYMAAALGKPMTVRAIKCDTVSHLPKRVSAFDPVPGCWMLAHDGGRSFVVEQSKHDGYFFCAMLGLVGADDAEARWTHRPVRGDYAELVLQDMGLGEPAAAAWRIGFGCRAEQSLMVLP